VLSMCYKLLLNELFLTCEYGRISGAGNCGFSDHLMIAEALKQFRMCGSNEVGGIKKQATAQKAFCQNYSLSFEKMSEVCLNICFYIRIG
jgi:hypothetical protein